MGLRVTAATAGQLVDRNERNVRAAIAQGRLRAEKQGKDWAIDVEDLGTVPGWRVDPQRLAVLQEREARTVESLATQVATLRAEVQALRSRMRLLELERGQGGHNTAATRIDPDGSDGHQDASEGRLEAPGHYSGIVRAGRLDAPAPVSLTYAAPAAAGTFRTRADAARWLQRHGIHSDGTPKSWPGWREVVLDPRAVLRLALSCQDASNWRVTWRLHRCADAACVCHELLPA